MKLPIYQVDAFADKPFSGNPAAVCPLENWLSDEQMQNIAMENNLAETAFFVKEEQGYRIRWFTPATEVELCGHATIASAYVLWHYLNEVGEQLNFNCLSGEISVTREEPLLWLDFPTREIDEPLPPADSYHQQLCEALGLHNPPHFVGIKNNKALIELSDQGQVEDLEPDFNKLKNIGHRINYVCAASETYDFVCRVFAPAAGINEDPVTGSAYTSLAPYWSKKLNKQELLARQVSARGGDVKLSIKNDRIKIGGQAKIYLKGHIYID